MRNIFLYFLYLHCTSSGTALEMWETYCSLFGVVTHESGVHHRLKAFKLTGVVYCNRTSLIFLVNDATHIHPLPSIFSRPLLLQVWVIHKFIWILFVSLQILVKLFASNSKIGILYNLNTSKYKNIFLINTLKIFLKWSVYM